MDFIFWLIIFFGGWVVWMTWLKRVSYTANFVFTSLYFVVLSLIEIAYFQDRLLPIVAGINSRALYPLIGLYIFGFLVFFASSKFLKRPDDLIQKSPRESWLRMDYRYLVSKSFDILFQQISIILLTLFLEEAGFSLTGIMILFALIFGSLHIPLVKTSGKLWGLYYTFFSVLSAFIFPYLIIKVEYGFIYSYIVHWLFYLISSLGVWICQNRRKPFY